MSELLESLNAPSEAPVKSWASEVAESAAAEPAPVAAEKPEPEPVVTLDTAENPAPEPSHGQETAPEEQDRRVPLKALQEERQKRAQYEQMLAQREQELFQMQQWAAQMQQQPQMGHNGGPPIDPDPETDPIGALKQTKEQLRQMAEQTAQQNYVTQLTQVAYNAANQFKQQVSDYDGAYKYALNSRAQELVALGANPQEVPAILHREELQLVDTALRNRRNPAEAIYHFAKARGFQGAPPPAPAAAPAANPAMQQQKAAVAASASAGGAPASKGQLSVSDIANLNGAAFDSAWNKLFGGNKSSVFRE